MLVSLCNFPIQNIPNTGHVTLYDSNFWGGTKAVLLFGQTLTSLSSPNCCSTKGRAFALPSFSKLYGLICDC